MSHLILPLGYTPVLDLYQTQQAIGRLRKHFQSELCRRLELCRATAPLFVLSDSGLNDDLNGVEQPVEFSIPAAQAQAQIVHSLAKWKRFALHEYGFPAGKGLYTDMNAIRREEELDNLHSVYVDQWDWEKVIFPEDRTRQYLEETVRQIVAAICDTQDHLRQIYPGLRHPLRREVTFLTTQELEDRWPQLTPKERENACAQEYGTVFLMQIGGRLRSGQRHDGRAPDYDDWTLNGDLLVWDEVLGCAVELSSMGIRVDPAALQRQLEEAGALDRLRFPFHRQLLEGKLPQTMGGGIGQSRLCLVLLEKAHIGEVQASVWDDETRALCRQAGIPLL